MLKRFTPRLVSKLEGAVQILRHFFHALMLKIKCMDHFFFLFRQLSDCVAYCHAKRVAQTFAFRFFRTVCSFSFNTAVTRFILFGSSICSSVCCRLFMFRPEVLPPYAAK